MPHGDKDTKDTFSDVFKWMSAIILIILNGWRTNYGQIIHIF